MKLSELTYEYLQSLGLSRSHMHTDCSDALRQMADEIQFNKAKADLMLNYGDVEVSIHPDADWFDQIKIEDEKWQAEHDEYINVKQEWCRKNGSD